MSSEVWVQVVVPIPDSLLCRLVRHALQCCNPNTMKVRVSSVSRGANSLPLSCIKDEILVATLVLILVPFEMLVGHLRVFSVFRVERGTGRLSLVLVAHVRDFLYYLRRFCSLLFRGFVVFLCFLWLCRGPVCSGQRMCLFHIFVMAFSWPLFFVRGPRFGQTSHIFALVKSSEHSRPVGDAILNKSSTSMAAMPD